VVVRPLGLSVLTESTDMLSKLESLSNIEVATAYKIAYEISRMCFKQNELSQFNLNATNLSSSDLLIRAISGIKLSI